MRASNYLRYIVFFIVGISAVFNSEAIPQKIQSRLEPWKIQTQTIHNDIITVGEAVTAIKAYLEHLIARYNLKIDLPEEQNLITKSKLAVYQDAGNEDESTPVNISKLYKIKRSLKEYLQQLYPESFVKVKIMSSTRLGQGELPYSLAKKRIRSSVKDYLFSCDIIDPNEAQRLWKSLKPDINRQLDVASYRSNNGLVVPQNIIGKILPTVYAGLTKRNILPHKKLVRKTIVQKPLIKRKHSRKRSLNIQNKHKKHHPIQSRRSFRSKRSATQRISFKKAESLVMKKLSNTPMTKKDRAFLKKIIMQKIKKNIKSGYVSPLKVQNLTDEEIVKFKKLQKKNSGQDE